MRATMTKWTKWTACALYSTVFTLAQGGEDVKFTTKPSAARSSDKTLISFSLSAPTDVEVSILDASGKVVRHLVAGVLGGANPPPEPLKPGLSQCVDWDGKDDTGKTASGGPFKVHVGAGMKPQFDSFLLHNPDGCGRITSLATGPAGTLYAFHLDSAANINCGGQKIKVYSRDGKHLKALTPFPADIAPARVKPLGVFQTAEGDLVPRIQNYETLNFYPDTIIERGRSMPERCMPAVDSKGRVYWMICGAMICAVDADGGIPGESFLGPRLLPEIKDLKMAGIYTYANERPSLAVSSDDKFVYIAGLSAGSGALPCVYRVDAEKRGPAEVFVGKSGQPGKEKDLLAAPSGLAVAKGLLYVADYQADRIAVFKESDRSFVGEIKVKAPDSIGVDPATEAVYVCSGTANPELTKFDGFKSGRAICHLALPRCDGAKEPLCRIAVDASVKPARIWIPEWRYCPHKLLCIEDAGEKFVEKGDPRAKSLWAEGPRDLSFDRQRNELYIKGNIQKYYRLDEKSDKRELIDLEKIPELSALANGTQLVPGTDGDLYTWSWGSGLWRFDHQGKPINWDGLGSPKIPIGGMMCFQNRNLALKPFAPPDELYVVPPGFYKFLLEGKTLAEARELNPEIVTSLNVIGQDGKTKRTVVWQCLGGAIPRVDAKGNIYVADLVKPPDRSYPEFFDGKLEAPPKQSGQGGGDDRFWTSYMYGSVIKFPPSGGIIWFKKDLPKSCMGQPSPELLAKPKVPIKVHFGYSPHLTGELQGALWYRFGYAPYSAWTSGMTIHCMCEGSGFDVDPYGRVFFPNLCQFRVEVIDTNNNPITTFGKYGNEDSGGKDAKVKKAEIPLAWPNYVAVSDTHAYVSDTVNRRVVSVKLNYAAEAVCPAP